MFRFAFQKLFILGAMILASAAVARAENIAIAGPISGTSQIIAAQMKQGTQAIAPQLSLIDTKCTSEGGEIAAQTAVSLNVQLLIGLPCIEALEAAHAYLTEQQSGIRIMALGVQLVGNARNDENATPIYRLAPDAEAEATALVQFVKSNWRNQNFALIDDGTLYGRLLAETVRARLEEDNLTPVFVDNYRPLQQRQTGLVRRLQRSGATHVIVGGDAYDAAIVGADAALLNFDIVMAGGSAFRAPPEDGVLPDGTVYIAQEQLFATVDGVELRDYAVLTRTALEIANQALAETVTNETELGDALSSATFQTTIGPVRFDASGKNNRDWYRVYEVQNGEPTALAR